MVCVLGVLLLVWGLVSRYCGIVDVHVSIFFFLILKKLVFYLLFRKYTAYLVFPK